jgi:hypothetical protein
VPAVVAAETAVVPATDGPVPTVSAVADTDGPVPAVVTAGTAVVSATEGPVPAVAAVPAVVAAEAAVVPVTEGLVLDPQWLKRLPSPQPQQLAPVHQFLAQQRRLVLDPQ